jgi:hypothetical protein
MEEIVQVSAAFRAVSLNSRVHTRMQKRNDFPPGLLIRCPPMSRDRQRCQQLKMFKLFAAAALLAVSGISLVALPAPRVEASETFALAKGDRLPVHSPVVDCSQQTWPDVALSCLKSGDPASPIQAARLVTARR